MLWTILIIVLLAILFLFSYLVIHGANMRRRNPEYGAQMDDEQEKILSKMKNSREK